LNLDRFVLDSERIHDDLSVPSLGELVRRAEEVEGPRVVITLPVRRSDFPERLKGVMRLLSRSERASLCLVAGNPAYLTEEERKMPAGGLLASAVKWVIGELGPETEVFVGTERVERVVAKLCAEHNVMPFLLLDDHSPELLALLRPNSNRLAVYVPFAVGTKRDDAIPSLLPYVERRMRALRLSGRPTDHLDRFCVVGNQHEITSRLTHLSRQYDVVIGYPANPDPEQIKFWSLLGQTSASDP